VNSVCVQGACLDGFYDRDPKIPGCETNCQKSNGGVEICDGQDNDCNGGIDDNPQAATISCRTGGVCAGVTPKCMGQSGWICTYPSTFQDVEDTTKTCDGLDNDCDGKIDEAFQIGKPCTVGSGTCAGTGTWVCDNSMAGGHRCMGTTKTPGTEICNGIDDDCDGKVDELESMSNKTTDDKLVYLAGPNVTMFAYEATRTDATGSNTGFDTTSRPCSVSGRQPWSNITKEEAQAACKKIGSAWRLCTAAEWQDACNGGSNTTFPYGNSYPQPNATNPAQPQKCNGYDYLKLMNPSQTPAPLATGAASNCVSQESTSTSGDELFDMSGNVKEWVLADVSTTDPLTCSTTPCKYELRGGAYDTSSFTVNGTTTAPGLQCDSTTPAPPSVPVRLPSVGFRCCLPGKLPN